MRAVCPPLPGQLSRLWLVLVLLGAPVAAETPAVPSMALYRRSGRDQPGWQHSLANLSAATECACLQRCLVDDRCLSVMLYPLPAAAATGSVATATTPGILHTATDAGQTAATVTTPDTPPTATAAGQTTASTSGTAQVTSETSAVTTATSSGTTTQPPDFSSVPSPVSCHLFTALHDEFGLGLGSPDEAKFCSREPATFTLFKKLFTIKVKC